MSMSESSTVTAMLRSAKILADAGFDFALAGGLAAWVHGAGESRHDVDFIVTEADAEAALDVLRRAGLRTGHPPEDWLVKAWDGDTLIDLIFRPRGFPGTEELIAAAPEHDVCGQTMRVMRPEDILVTKLLALSDVYMDYSSVIEPARHLSSKVDWDEVRHRTAGSPYVAAFFTLADGLGLCGRHPEEPYLGAWLSDRLAHDDRVAKQDVDVRISGHKVVLGGIALTEARRASVGSVAAELLPGYEIVNEISVADLAEPTGSEMIG
jgi:hypothetical protein